MALQTGLLLLLKHKITLIYLLLFIRFITRCHSLSLAAPLVVIRCTLSGKKVGEKWVNFSPAFFFPTSIFPRFFFTWQRIYPDFSYPELLLLFPIYLQNLLLPFFFMYFKHFQRYTNADLKISLYVLIHIKIISWNFFFPDPKNSWVIHP